MLQLAVQQNMTILVNAYSKHYRVIRRMLLEFAELLKHPQGLHTFRMTPLTLWNAAAKGMSATNIIDLIEKYFSNLIPINVKQEIVMWIGRYGLFILRGQDYNTQLTLHSTNHNILEKMWTTSEVGSFFLHKPENGFVAIQTKYRGCVKQAFVHAGYPIIDLVSYQTGQPLFVKIGGKEGISPRPYQEKAVQAFVGREQQIAGDGVIVLPCGAGKTIVGILALVHLQSETLILTSNMTSVQQWKYEILARTTLQEDQVGVYNRQQKQVRSITISTYQMLTYRRSKNDQYEHMQLFNKRNWGLIIYDEVHLLPAPVFRTTANLQATRRLGLTATLIREDGCEKDVFSLIGPKRYDLPWRELEQKGWVAAVDCVEVRIPLIASDRQQYVQAGARKKIQIAATNQLKMKVVQQILNCNPDLPTLIIGQYLQQLTQLARFLSVPILTGCTPQAERERLYAQFKQGIISILIVSKVANFAVDLPDATIAIQISGSFGSRQEEAQRLGRLLRPKTDGRTAIFYSIISADTKEQDYALRRQRFLLEQGYQYAIEEEVNEYATNAPVDGRK